MKHFILIGNGGGGTTCTQRLLNSHSQIECLFENKGQSGSVRADSDLTEYLRLAAEAEARGLIWGNKEPIEQFVTRGYSAEQIERLSDHFKIIWLMRRFSRYDKPRTTFALSHQKWTYRQTWDWARERFWACKDKHPETVINLSWEDLLLRPKIELARICTFLGVLYEPAMLSEHLKLEKV